MKHLLRKCPSCKTYTLHERCTICNNTTLDPHPPKFSMDDKYIRYRIEEKYLNKD
ncbi:MAG TPA: RNA-protein complex protein Nop10 [Nitrososphaeraceae archaeon]|nr:RNA-protein complex protein Nop10 [Nitrososphaeraceae archaeon]